MNPLEQLIEASEAALPLLIEMANYRKERQGPAHMDDVYDAAERLRDAIARAKGGAS